MQMLLTPRTHMYLMLTRVAFIVSVQSTIFTSICCCTTNLTSISILLFNYQQYLIYISTRLAFKFCPTQHTSMFHKCFSLLYCNAAQIPNSHKHAHTQNHILHWLNVREFA